MRRTLIRLYKILGEFGLDPLLLIRALQGWPAFYRDYHHFRSGYAGRILLKPCLHNRYDEVGIAKSEYFWQDLLVARWIHEAKPDKHVDVGSRIDGFVTHVASFREIEVFDIRPIAAQIPGVRFRRVDLTDRTAMKPWHAGGKGYCDSLSCLHVVEHFGLGRYGDKIQPRGYEEGFRNLIALLKLGGRFYLSTPIGQERVEFNANRVFDPRTILHYANINGLMLERFIIFDLHKGLLEIDKKDQERKFEELATYLYNLGIFVFCKLK